MSNKIFKKYQNEHYKKYPPLKIKRLTPAQAEALQKQEGVEMKQIENNSGEVISKANSKNTVKYCDDNLHEDPIQDNLKQVPINTTQSQDGEHKNDNNIDEK